MISSPSEIRSYQARLEHGKLVVHGHTPSLVPEIRSNRIGIDTAAYATGRLTCLVLEKDQRRFLHVGGHDAAATSEAAMGAFELENS